MQSVSPTHDKTFLKLTILSLRKQRAENYPKNLKTVILF